jgi:hypothetical protein
MSRKHTKRYLMLLAAVGLLAIGANGSGTFASFNAEVANNGNTFASGTLFLHDTNGATTCASESVTSNSNLGTPFTADNGCAILFTATLPNYNTTLSTTLIAGSPITSLPVNAVPQVPAAGDELVLTSGGNSQKFYVTTAPSPSASTIQVDSQSPNFAYPATTTTVVDDAHFARLKLNNAGSLPASGIKFSLGSGGCSASSSYSTANTVGTGGASGTSLPLGTPLAAGVYLPSGSVVTISDGVNSETVHTAAAAGPGAVALTVTTLASSHVATTAITLAVSFGNTGFCSLPITVVETDFNYAHDETNQALGCAYGQSNLAGYGCTFDGISHQITNVGTSLQALTLASGGSGNNLAQLDPGGSRYFVIGVQAPTPANNAYQNKQAKFDLVWHIDQA